MEQIYNENNNCHLSDCNGIRKQNYLVCKRTLKHLAQLIKTLKYVVRNYVCCVSTVLFYHITYTFILRIACFEQGAAWHSVNNRVQVHSRCVCDLIKTLRHFVIFWEFILIQGHDKSLNELGLLNMLPNKYCISQLYFIFSEYLDPFLTHDVFCKMT